MAQQPKGTKTAESSAEAEAPRERVEPIGSVRRELVRPDGTKVMVDVPVYPPFRLEGEKTAPPAPASRRLRAGPRPKRTGGAE